MHLSRFWRRRARQHLALRLPRGGLPFAQEAQRHAPIFLQAAHHTCNLPRPAAPAESGELTAELLLDRGGLGVAADDPTRQSAVQDGGSRGSYRSQSVSPASTAARSSRHTVTIPPSAFRRVQPAAQCRQWVEA